MARVSGANGGAGVELGGDATDAGGDVGTTGSGSSGRSAGSFVRSRPGGGGAVVAADPTGPPRGADSNDGDRAIATSVVGSTGTDGGVSEAATVLRASRDGCRPRTLSDWREAVAYVGDTEGDEPPRAIEARSESFRTTR